MKIFAIHGGPRKSKNTDLMLKSFISGAKSMGDDVEVETIQLFDYDYKGCYGCYSCKLNNDVFYGKCNYPDSIKEIIERVSMADGIVCGTPIYFHDISGQLRSFLERLFFQYHSFVEGEKSLAPKKIYSAMIYTMNITKQQMLQSDYRKNLSLTEHYFDYTFYSYPDIIYAYNTLLMDDYSRHELSLWDGHNKKQYHDQQFEIDLQSAFVAGVRMVKKIRGEE